MTEEGFCTFAILFPSFLSLSHSTLSSFSSFLLFAFAFAFFLSNLFPYSLVISSSATITTRLCSPLQLGFQISVAGSGSVQYM